MWSAKHIVNLLNLVYLIIPREEGEKWQDFKEDASYSPHIHFVIIVAVREQTFRRSVPSCRNIFLGLIVDYCEGLVWEDASTTSEISEFKSVLHNQ